MDLSFSELKKRDVINTIDGKCLGKMTDLELSFPNGELIGIIVPGKRTNCFTRLFDHTKIYIDVSKITKIGGDVILVKINCGDTCAPNVRGNVPPPYNPCNPCSPCKAGSVSANSPENVETSIFDE